MISRAKRYLLVFGFFLLTVVGVELPEAAPIGFATIGDAGYAWSQRTGWVQAFTASSQPVYGSGAFNPSAAFRPFVDGADRYENRYGKGSWEKKGTLVGERAAGSRLLDVLNTLVHAPNNPLGIADPAHYVVSDVDQEDARLIARGSLAWYDAVLVPAYNRVAPPTTPVPVPTPTPAPDPPPVVPPPATCVHLRVPAQDIFYLPSTLSTGQAIQVVLVPGSCP